MSDLYDRTPVLRELLVDKTVVTPDGERRPSHSSIHERYAKALYLTILKEKPDVVLEVGMAQGASTLAILTALEQLGRGGRLVSVDPNQSAGFESQGIYNVERAGLQDRHELIEEPDYTALPRLLQDGLKLDFAYIDGWHTFDYTLLDFWYIGSNAQGERRRRVQRLRMAGGEQGHRLRDDPPQVPGNECGPAPLDRSGARVDPLPEAAVRGAIPPHESGQVLPQAGRLGAGLQFLPGLLTGRTFAGSMM